MPSKKSIEECPEVRSHPPTDDWRDGTVRASAGQIMDERISEDSGRVLLTHGIKRHMTLLERTSRSAVSLRRPQG